MSIVAKVPQQQLAGEARLAVGGHDFLVGRVVSSFYPDYLPNPGAPRGSEVSIRWNPEAEGVIECWVAWPPPHAPVRFEAAGTEYIFCLDGASDTEIAAAATAKPECETFR